MDSVKNTKYCKKRIEHKVHEEMHLLKYNYKP